ncbi:SDR family oxidoreductase [Commensalibacter oyaizuii]|uniref:SDR family oxidoreductase n=1 Tax=Commensalibacter oyaizuii TaxID=3043873 RepID=A0ABT6Q227_9PROT|nr:SDR family oxidoreductase [Commensalibacter sp. TBRC 16381]MDI2091168.1 SDR family oxidoreductase [Commensalibacter sp. TBRC 16381]
MDLKIKDKIYIITGGGSGIGGGISLSLAKEGAIPVIFGRSALKPEFKKEIEQIQPKYVFVRVNLTDTEGCKKAVQDILNQFGRIDGLVNCAGGNDSISLEAGIDQFRQSLENNLIHCYAMAHFCIDALKKTHGTIVNIGSKTSLTGQGNTSGYTAAKGALLSLTREWAASYLDDNIRVNAIIVAECWTPLYERWIHSFDNPKEKLQNITKNIPLGRRMTTIEEIADTTVFILSPRSSHTTGQWIIVDGGYTNLDRVLTA